MYKKLWRSGNHKLKFAWNCKQNICSEIGPKFCHLPHVACHFRDVTWVIWRPKSPVIQLFVQSEALVFWRTTNQTPKLRSIGPLRGETTGDLYSPSQNATNVHYDDVIMTMLASQITSLTVVYSIVYSGVNQRKHQSSASLAFVRGIHRGPVNFPHKWPVTRKMFPFDDVIME